MRHVMFQLNEYVYACIDTNDAPIGTTCTSSNSFASFTNSHLTEGLRKALLPDVRIFRLGYQEIMILQQSDIFHNITLQQI